MILIYQILLLLASPLLVLWMICRVAVGKLPGLGERLGSLGRPIPDSQPRVWIHAVSLGEIKVATALVEDLRRAVPELSAVYTTTTETGRQEALRRARERDHVLYSPIDLNFVCRRFLRHISPNLVIVVETELWPNLIHEASAAGIPLVIVNGRISDRSWPRYRMTKWFWRGILGNVYWVYPSSDLDASRFRELGLPSGKIAGIGNLKFESASAAGSSSFLEAARNYSKSVADGKIFVAGSTMPGEEAILLEVFRELRLDFPSLCMVVAPRHPERFDEVAGLLTSHEIRFIQRSKWMPSDALPAGGVVLLDTIGELSSIYEFCDLAFVGGTLTKRGGHNVVEPASFGKAVLVGPSMENFRAIMQLFTQEDPHVKIPGAAGGSIAQVEDAGGLLTAARHLLTYPEDARRLGTSAKQVVINNQKLRSEIVKELASKLVASRKTISSRGSTL